MREIKFRAWIKNDTTEGVGILMPWDSLQERDGFWTEEGLYLMQFTGLLDKQGKDIYEGDIIKGTVNSIRKKGSYLIPVKPMEVTWDYDLLAFIKNSIWYELEVIGNIYENPELLDNKIKLKEEHENTSGK